MKKIRSLHEHFFAVPGQHFPMFHMTTDCLMFVPKFMQLVFLLNENRRVDLLVWTCKAKWLKHFDNVTNAQDTKTCF